MIYIILTIFVIVLALVATFNPGLIYSTWLYLKDKWMSLHPSDKATLKLCLFIECVLAVWAATEFI